MLEICVCDDEKEYIKDICGLLTDISFRSDEDMNISTYTSPSRMIKDIEGGRHFDIILLDIVMGSENGIEAARRIRRVQPDVIIILLSSYSDYMQTGYEVRAFRYILKSEYRNCLEHVIDDAVAELKKDEYFSFEYRREQYRIRVRDILYFESDRRCVMVNTSDVRSVFYGKLDEIRLADFIRIHRSYLVNPRHVMVFNQSHVRLSNGVELPVSKSYGAEAKRKFMLSI